MAKVLEGAGGDLVTLDRGWRVMLIDLGFDLDEVARRAGIAPHLVWQDTFRIPVTQYLAMVDALEALDADPLLLPLRIGQSWNPSVFSPVFFAAMCSSNLTVAFERIAAHKRLVAPMRVDVQTSREGLFVTWGWDDPTYRLPRLLVATELILMLQIARVGLRQPVRPLRLVSPVAIEPRATYEEFFGIRITRGARPGLLFSREDAERPFATASEEMWNAFEPTLRRRQREHEASMPVAERVRSALFECLPGGEASIDGAASRLSMSGRTLQRRLATESVSFRELLQDTRHKLALHYLKNTELPYEEISFLLGFEEPNSFFRAFREWTGTTPETTRLSRAKPQGRMPRRSMAATSRSTSSSSL